MTALEVLCTECGKPIDPIGTAVALRFTVLNDRANWAQRYEHRPLPGTFHGGCAEAAFRRNAETFNNPDPRTRLGRWLAEKPGRTWLEVNGAIGSEHVSLLEEQTRRVATGDGPTLEAALTAALDRAIASEAKREDGAT